MKCSCCGDEIEGQGVMISETWVACQPCAKEKEIRDESKAGD